MRAARRSGTANSPASSSRSGSATRWPTSSSRRRRRSTPLAEVARHAEPARCRIEIDGLRKTFLANGRDVVAVDDASFKIGDGQFVALLGPSGCGKSTILNMVATLIAPNGGTIRVDGAPVVPGRP